MKELLALTRRCIQDYNMIPPGEKVAVGVSGGKDSLSLLYLLARLREFYPGGFDLYAITLDMGFEGMDFSPLAAFCQRIGVPFVLKKTQMKQVIFDIRQESNPCSLCAKMRRGALNDAALALGCRTIALGHHFDDAVQTFFMNLFYGGKIGCFSPKTYLSRKKITVIRPLVFCEEREITGAARRLALPIVKSACPADGVTARKDTADLVKQLEKQFPHLRTKVLGAMQRANLDGWGDTTS